MTSTSYIIHMCYLLVSYYIEVMDGLSSLGSHRGKVAVGE